MKYGSLFSGIGGFDLGFDRAGMKCTWQVEIDKDCQAVLARHWPNVERFNDVRQCGKDNLAAVDVICGGFPCQDLSVAGKREGLAGERSGLWHEFHRIVAELRPPWVVIENVPGLLSSNKGEDFAIILRGLVECGYGVCWRVLDARYFGVAQRRRRVFIVGSLGDGRSAEVLFEREGLCGDTQKGSEAGAGIAETLIARYGKNSGGANDDWGKLIVSSTLGSHHGRNDLDSMGVYIPDLAAPLTVSAANHGGATGGNDSYPHNHIVIPFKTTQITSPGNYSNPQAGDPCHPLAEGMHPPAIAFTERTRSDGRNFEYQEDLAYALTNPASGGRTHSRQIACYSGVRRLTPIECSRLQGFPDDWNEWGIDENGKRVDLSDSARYRQDGNAVCRDVAEWMGKRLEMLS